MKILFRTAGGRDVKRQLGMGHIFRCINLSKEFRKHEVYFLTEDFGSVNKTLREYDIKNILRLKPNAIDKDAIKRTRNIVKREKIDVLIIDKFGITKKYVSKVRKFVRVVVISDLENIDFDADLVVNGFIGFRNGIKYNKYKTRCLLGPKFQIINKIYSKKSQSKKEYDVLITVGGFDARNIIKKVINRLSIIKHQLKICVILGPATTNITKLKKVINQNVHQFTIVKKTNNMKKLISRSRFGICGGGITTYEFASQQVPFAIICQYPHQIITAKVWERKKIAKNLRFIRNNKEIDFLVRQIIDGTVKMKKTNTVDGLGVVRIANEISKLGNVKSFKLR